MDKKKFSKQVRKTGEKNSTIDLIEIKILLVAVSEKRSKLNRVFGKKKLKCFEIKKNNILD